MEVPDRIKHFAKSEDFPVVTHLGDWEGFIVFLADTEEECSIGLPQYILSKDKNIRWASPVETGKIMSHFI